MKQIKLNMWTGNYLSSNFIIIRPHGADHVGQLVEVYDDSKVFLGYAKVVAVTSILFNQISDTVSYAIIGKPAPYFKTVLNRIDPHHMDNGKPICIVALQWTEMNLENVKIAVQLHYQNLMKPLPFAADRAYCQQLVLNLS